MAKHAAQNGVNRSLYREPLVLSPDTHQDIQFAIGTTARSLMTSTRPPTKILSHFVRRPEEPTSPRAYRLPPPFEVTVSSDYFTSDTGRQFGLRAILGASKGRVIDAEIEKFSGRVPAHEVNLVVKDDGVDEGYRERHLRFDALTATLARLLKKPELAEIGHIRSGQTLGEALVKLPAQLDATDLVGERSEVYRAGAFSWCAEEDMMARYFSERGTRLEIHTGGPNNQRLLWLASVALVELPKGMVGQQLTYKFTPDDPTSPPKAYMDLMSAAYGVEELAELTQPPREVTADVALGALELLMNPQY